MNIIEHIDLYYWCTPNGDKVLILLEELGIPYSLKPINILQGDQFDQAFLAHSPNNKIPAIEITFKDGSPWNKKSIFESGAILLTLAEYAQELLGHDKTEVLQWLFWQVGGLGPMAGQTHHFRKYAPEVIPYAKARYEKETARLYGVLETQLQHKDYIAGEYSIADIACYPWMVIYEGQGINIEAYPNVSAWLQRLSKREAIIKTKAVNTQLSQYNDFDESARKHLFK